MLLHVGSIIFILWNTSDLGCFNIQVFYNYYFLILPILAMMPEDKDSDFDIHLQHSISALQSINNAMQFDVVVLYCSDDIPSKTNPGVDPFKIRDELKNWGFSV